MSALLMRRVILQVSGHPGVERLVRANADKFGIGRFVAGESLEEAVAVAGRLQAKGLQVTMDRLGEYVKDLSQAREAMEQILSLADALHAAGTNDRPFEIVPRCRGDSKNTLRLRCDSAALRDDLAKRFTAAGLSYWTLDRYNLAAHPVLRDHKSIYADGFPWNLQSEPQDFTRFASIRDQLARIICLPIPPELNAAGQSAFSEQYVDVLRAA